jgi:tetratricopeptide (TPR) repeat protein
MSTHLVKHQKITKRQIKEDPLVTAAFKATAFWEVHGTKILIGVGAVVLVGVLAFFMMQARSKAEAEASGDLFRASLAVANGDYQSAAPMLQQIVNEQPGTAAARDAMLYLGDAQMAMSKPAEAVTWYRKYIEKAGGDKERVRIGNYALATALEDSKQYVPAAEAYATAAKQSSSDNDRARAMHGEARSYVRASQVPKAVEVLTAIVRLPGAEQSLQDAAKAQMGELQAGRVPATASSAPAATPATP